MTGSELETKYFYGDAEIQEYHGYLIPHLDHALADPAIETVFDLGCGNGSILRHLSHRFDVVGVDASVTGVAQANAAYPALKIHQGSAYDDLATAYGTFDAVVSLEVVEHLFDPRLYARQLFALVRPGGRAVVSTPYHGYFKNLAIALAGGFDRHFTALWDGGHIKFWSVATLTELLAEAGFVDIEFRFAGRTRWLAKSMVAIARRPELQT